jgi:hypothetical protein
MIVQEELKKVILEEALASGLDREDAEQLTELTFERWTELIRDEVPDRDTQLKEHLSNEKLLELLRTATDETWAKFMKEKKEQE